VRDDLIEPGWSYVDARVEQAALDRETPAQLDIVAKPPNGGWAHDYFNIGTRLVQKAQRSRARCPLPITLTCCPLKGARSLCSEECVTRDVGR